TTSYHIGNSLTEDMQPLGLEQLAQIGGESLETGYHFAYAKSLDYIWANPTSVSNNQKRPDFYTPSLTGYAWDVLTLQPSNGPESTLATDEASILSFIDLARSNPDNADTDFYIYAAWPRRGNYADKWTASVADQDSTATVKVREYFDHLINRLHDATSANVLMIPIGEVLFELDQKMQAGDIPGFTSVDQLYRDNVHLSSDVGRYTAAATAYATIFGKDPTGLTKPDGFYGSPDAFTPQLYNALHTVIWDVVANHPFTGILDPSILIGDVDFDADIDFDDIDAFVLGLGDPDAYVAAFGVDPVRRGDTDGDNDFDFDDIPGFVALLESGAVEDRSQTIPEPTTIALGVIALLSVCWRARRPRLRLALHRR
ncbi:MAG: DUF4886 domain-containing protein, partial [Pirellulales bacterium]